MIALSDSQLYSVMQAAQPLDPSKRATMMERVAAQLRLTGARYPSDDDVARAIKLAMAGLQHAPAV